MNHRLGRTIVLTNRLDWTAEQVALGCSAQQDVERVFQFVLLYPPPGRKGPKRVATVLSKQTLPQQALAKTLGLDQLSIIPIG